MIFDGKRLVQAVNLMIALAASAVYIRAYITALDKSRRAYAVAPILYFLNVSAFYTVVFLNAAKIIHVTFLTDWSAAVNLHSLLMVCWLGYYTVLRREKWPII